MLITFWARYKKKNFHPLYRQKIKIWRIWRKRYFHLLLWKYAAAAAKLLQSSPTLWDPIDGSPPGSPVPGILQARTLEWAAISFSSAWKWKVKVKSLSPVWLFSTPWTAAYQALPSMGFSRLDAGVGCHCLLRVKVYDTVILRAITWYLAKF